VQYSLPHHSDRDDGAGKCQNAGTKYVSLDRREKNGELVEGIQQSSEAAVAKLNTGQTALC